MGLAGDLGRLVRYAWRHPMGRRDRIGTFRRIVDWQVRSRLTHGPLVRPWLNDAKLRLARGHSGATGNLYFGFYEFADMAFFAHLLRPGDTFADIGANVGSYTILAGKVVGATVHAFEPSQATADTLAANCHTNGIGDRVTVHRLALAASTGTARFTTGLDATNQFASADASGTVEVRIDTADNVLGEAGVVAMKVDVEGAEDRVFQGALSLIHQPQLIAIEVETLMPGVRELIEGAGFVERWYDPFERRLDRAPNRLQQHNHLFVRDEDAVIERLRAAPAVRFGRQAI